MKTYSLANTHRAIELPAIGFGAMGISEFYGETDQASAQAAVSHALQHGISHFDTADSYAFGDNERWLRQALALDNDDLRASRIIGSKAALVRDASHPERRDICIAPGWLRGQLQRSLENLGTGYLDIFTVHRLPSAASEAELLTLADHLNRWRDEGLMHAVGISEPSLAQLRLLHAHCPLSVVQSEYSLLERSVERNGILDFCRAEGIRFIAYSPLSRGLLSDGFHPDSLTETDFRRGLPRFSGDNFAHNNRLLTALRQLAAEKQLSLSTFALAWLLAQQVAVIPGMRKPQRVDDALAALAVSFTSEELAAIEAIAPPDAARGERYSRAASEVYGFSGSQR
ncbi:hypothetical protein EM595_1803 [Duffyella gerundensis]|uniref:NADP-dependent oxidoreductase domain-containing protein n=1 Tax=Duffyella gerundensis TaxID=1619313 RepID=A0A0U5L4R2_9GAMM|nr:aldo/keto reductase [Duffyella gerundensis]CUU24037.1 hypothetical protein EM595_1803 [Duffyella gerundensis]